MPFPTTAGAFQTTQVGSYEAFATKLNPTGTGLVYSTFLGGSGDDRGQAIAVDAAGNAYVTGLTTSVNFPTINPIKIAHTGGTWDAFVTKLDPTGAAAAYSTYLGGNSDDRGNGIAIDTAGNAIVAGMTFSGNFPTTAGVIQSANGGDWDSFVLKLTDTGDHAPVLSEHRNRGDEQGKHGHNQFGSDRRRSGHHANVQSRWRPAARQSIPAPVKSPTRRPRPMRSAGTAWTAIPRMRGINNPSLTNAITYTTGAVDQAAQFGTGSYMEVPDNGTMDNQQYSLEAWEQYANCQQ